MTDKQIIKKFNDNHCLVLENNQISLREDEITAYRIVLGKSTNELLEFVKDTYLQLKRKEQECEELKKIINEAKNSNLDLKSFLVSEAVQNEYEQQLYQLKQTLAEIKEIAEIEIECKTYEIENDCFNETRCKALNEHIDFIKQILQKISESEVENE